MVRLKILPIVLLCLLCLTFTPLTANAALTWNLQEQTGEWETSSYNYWKSNHNSNPATLVYNATLENLVMWRFKTELKGDSSWMLMAKGKTSFLCGDNGVQIEYVVGRNNIFNLWDAHYMLFWVVNGNVSTWDLFYDSGVRYSPITFEITFYRSQDDKLVCVVQHPQGKYVKTFDVSSWNFTLTIKNEKIGGTGIDGYIEGTYENEETLTGLNGIPDPTPEWAWYQGIINALNNFFITIYLALPDWAKDAVDAFNNFLNFVWIAVNLTVQFLMGIAPYVGALYAVYWIGLVVKCCKEGSVEPILDHIYTVIKVFSAIVQAIRALLPVP